MRGLATVAAGLGTGLGAAATSAGCAAARTLRVDVGPDGAVALGGPTLEAVFARGAEPVLLKGEGWPEAVVLIRRAATDGGLYRALGATCTHLGCQVRPGRRFLVCPCHGSTYDLDGRVVRGPAPRALTEYTVEARPEGGIAVRPAAPAPG